MISNGFLGYDRFVWFQGVVEDRMDPQKLGRLRVRILGYHTEDKTKIPTKDLPWAFPIMPISSASMNGIGEAPVGCVEGTWVIGFFRDGENCQEPVVFGTIGGIPQEKARSNIGFSDPLAHYPEEDHLKEPDTNRLARNEKIDKTVIEQRKKNLANKGEPIRVALQGESENGGPRDTDTEWLEPKPPYSAQYPFNKVFQTEGGIVKEWDDTPDHRRIHEYHPCGTFYEVYEEKGKAHKITKINGENYTIVLGDDHIFVTGSVNITAEGRVNIYAGNDINVEANNKLTIHAKKDTTIFCNENITIDAVKDIVMKAGGDININSAGSTRISCDENFSVSAGAPDSTKGSINLTSNTSTLTLTSKLGMNISSTTAGAKLYSATETIVGSNLQTLVDGKTTTIQSDAKTSVGSKLLTSVTAGTLLNLNSTTSQINLSAKISINSESPIVTRLIPKTQPLGKPLFDPVGPKPVPVPPV